MPRRTKPKIRDIVLYTLTYDDMTRANERSRPPRDRNYEGFDHTAGQVLPMIVTSLHEGVDGEVHSVSGQVFLNGNATLFVNVVPKGDGEGEWHW